MSVYIELYHGHHYPNEELDDWGFEGPLLGPFPFFHVTYNCTVNCGDDPIMVMGNEYPFPYWDKDDFLPFLGSYYGDMSISSPETLNDEYLKRLTKTKEILRTPFNQIPKLINDSEEWVKVYANMVLINKGLALPLKQ